MQNAISIIKSRIALLVVLTVFGLIDAISYEATARADDEAAVLKLARAALKIGGVVGILDWADPARTALRWALHALLATVEPSSAMDWINTDFQTQLKQSGFGPIEDHVLAFGAARVVVATRR